MYLANAATSSRAASPARSQRQPISGRVKGARSCQPRPPTPRCVPDSTRTAPNAGSVPTEQVNEGCAGRHSVRPERQGRTTTQSHACSDTGRPAGDAASPACAASATGNPPKLLFWPSTRQGRASMTSRSNTTTANIGPSPGPPAEVRRPLTRGASCRHQPHRGGSELADRPGGSKVAARIRE
jgi:hypothetical protein